MLKADLHIHTKEDGKDHFINYTAEQLIDEATKKNYDVLAITLHSHVFYDEIKDYAEKKGILLIPGMEKKIEGKDVLLLNFTQEEADKITHFEDIRRFKKNNQLIIAPHPFFKKRQCLGRKLKQYKDVFDAVEQCFLYNHLINFNKKAFKVAKKLNLPVVANSDVHFLENFDGNYTLINAEKNINSVVKAIKKGKVKIKSKPISIFKLGLNVIRYTFVKNDSIRN